MVGDITPISGIELFRSHMGELIDSFGVSCSRLLDIQVMVVNSSPIVFPYCESCFCFSFGGECYSVCFHPFRECSVGVFDFFPGWGVRAVEGAEYLNAESLPWVVDIVEIGMDSFIDSTGAEFDDDCEKKESCFHLWSLGFKY